MKLLVALKQILDPEISPRDFRIDPERMAAQLGDAALVTNIFCENALEVALQLRDSNEAEVTAVTFGPASAEDSLRKALALRVDRAVHVLDPSDTFRGSAAAAAVLAATAQKLGEFDLVLCGREAGDWGEGRTAGLLAERLQLPCVSFVDRIEVADGGLRLQRQTDFGREEVLAPSPVVVSITNCDSNLPRIPKTRDIMLAHRKELTSWSLDDLGLDATFVQREAEATEVVDLVVPETETKCEFIGGDSEEERIRSFAERIAAVVRSL